MALDKDGIAKRIAQELQDRFYVNLGIGIPTLVANYIPQGISVEFQSENGILGMGPFPFSGEEDADLINAGKQTITSLPESSYFSSADSFAMIRGGHIDVTVLGGLQVSKSGDLANWMIMSRGIGSIGGAMDLVTGAKEVIVTMEHVTKNNDYKILQYSVDKNQNLIENLRMGTYSFVRLAFNPLNFVFSQTKYNYGAKEGIKNLGRDLELPKIIKNLGGKAWHVYRKDITKKSVEIAHDENLTVNVWTVNKEYDMLTMIDYGVDGIMTDYPLRLKELCEKRNIKWF